MFDDQDKQDQSATAGSDATATSTSPFPSSTDTTAVTDNATTDTTASSGAPVLPSFDTTPAVDPVSSSDDSAVRPLAEPAAPVDSSDNSSSTSPVSDPVVEPASASDDKTKTEEPAVDMPSAPEATPGDDDLSGMKQEALDELHPLFEHLELSPEEEFKTTMMMIQANDDKTMLKKAFEAAKKISDDKARSHALLDVINEINYFTQKVS